MPETREYWSSRAGFVLASIGSAVGLGSIWKFPYEAGSHGGGLFILVYLIGLALIVYPLMLVELAIGRRGRAGAVGSLVAVASASGGSRRWGLLGALGVVTSFLILSFYSVIGGWALHYAVDAVRNGVPEAAAGASQARFDALLASPLTMSAYHTLFMIGTGVVVARGIASGIERACNALMPVLIVLIVALAIYAAIEGDVAAAAKFLFAFGNQPMTPKVVIEALGLGFFSIGVGMAVMITYASYAKPDISLRQVTIVTIVGDTAISFLAGFAIFPIVFAEGLDPASGPGLIFVILPVAFAKMPFGAVAALAFFVLLTVAALASAMSMLEMPVAYLRDALGWSRRRAAVIATAACWALGLGSVLSFNLLSHWHPLSWLPVLAQATLFDCLDYLTSNVLLPAGALATALFGGFVVAPRILTDELELSPGGRAVVIVALRYVVPLAIVTATVAPLIW